MLLFSTVLDIKDSITPDDFIQLVIKWNNTSTHTENIVTGIEWQGERTARFGDDRLWLEFAEYPEKGILAARHVKITPDGVTWASDFVVNSNCRTYLLKGRGHMSFLTEEEKKMMVDFLL